MKVWNWKTMFSVVHPAYLLMLLRHVLTIPFTEFMPKHLLNGAHHWVQTQQLFVDILLGDVR